MMIASHTKRLLIFLAIRRIVIMSLKALKMNEVIFEPRAAYQGWKSARSHDHTFARPHDRTTARPHDHTFARPHDRTTAGQTT